MTGHSSIGALDEAQHREATAARERIAQAEEHIAYYRSQMIRVQEHFSEVARVAGVQDAPEFRFELRRVTAQIDEEVVGATRVVARFAEELDDLTVRHRREQEDLGRRLRETRPR